MNDLLVRERLAALEHRRLLSSCGNALPLLPGGQVVVQSGGAKARNVLGTGYLMDNRDYPCSVMPDALCCWVFHLPPNAGLCVRYVWDSRHVTEPSERVGPRPSAIGYVAKGDSGDLKK